MALPQTLTVMMIAALVLVIAPGPAMADCVGPNIEHDAGSVDRDGTVHVVGSTWGDNCYDTGPPPPGESTIGRPVTGIEVLLVQGGVEHLVAMGDADGQFGFVVDVPVPDKLEPGPVKVVARSAMNVNTYNATSEPLVVSERPPSGEGDDAIVRLGGSERVRT